MSAPGNLSLFGRAIELLGIGETHQAGYASSRTTCGVKQVTIVIAPSQSSGRKRQNPLTVLLYPNLLSVGESPINQLVGRLFRAFRSALAVGLASLVALTTRRRARGGEAPEGSFARRLGQGFEVHTGRLSGAAAAIQVILPLAAVSFGMTIFAVIHHLDVFGA